MKLNLQSFKNVSPANALMGAGALFLVILSISAVTLLVTDLTKPGTGYEGRTITVSATGDAYQTPDVAEFTYTVHKEGKDVATVQDEATKQSNDVLGQLTALGVESKDIQTQNITANPKYEWQTKAVVCGIGQYCPPEGKNVLVGYESSTTVSVKLRDLTLAGKVLQLLGQANVENISGPSFTAEDPDAAKNEARIVALTKAGEKAKAMAKAMNVGLGKVVTFSEDGSNYPQPMYATAGVAMDSKMAIAPEAAPAPVISAGQDKVSVTVNVVYKIN